MARIGDSGSTNGLIRNLSDATQKKQGLFEKLATGKRINRAVDDAAGLAIVNDLEAATKVLSQVDRNIGDFNSLVDITDSAIGQVSDIKVRLDELAAQSANGTLSNEQRASLQTEFNALRDEIGRIAATTEFNGVKPLSGNTSLSAQVGQDSSANSQITVDGANLQGVISDLSTLDISTESGARSALDSLSTIGSDLATKRGTFGAVQSRLDAARENAGSQRLASEEAASRIRDADIADTTARLTAQNIRSQGGVAILAQANQNKANVLQLLS